MYVSEYHDLVREVAERLGYDPREVDQITLSPTGAKVRRAFYRDGSPVVVDADNGKGYATFTEDVTFKTPWYALEAS
jgi:hypothetical protein